MKVYPRYEAQIEMHNECLHGNGKVTLTLFENEALLEAPCLGLRLTYSKKNAKELIELMKLFVERVQLEEERKRLLR